jgi:anti-sigma regulatory factor (Ser/Thr protein kinase)
MDPIVLPGELASLSVIGRYVVDAATAAGLDRADAYRLRLAVDEIATNVVVHGYQEANETGSVAISATIDDRTLTIAVEDTARAFDPTTMTLPDEDELDLPLEERDIGGLGVMLAREGVDDFRYERIEGRNRTMIVVNRPEPVTSD